MKVYVELITFHGISYIGSVYNSLETFEKFRNDNWNGECQWTVRIDSLKGNGFISYELILTNINGVHRYLIHIEEKEVSDDGK